MATRRTQLDPAELANEQILKAREERISAQAKPIPDLELGLEDKEPDTAAELLRDEWDKRAFGEPARNTATRIIYGPDPLYDGSPALQESIKKYGLHDYAEATAQAIKQKGEMALPDPLLRRGMKRAIDKFGVEAVSAAFAERILKIPVRTVEYELDDEFDSMIMGGRMLDECVARYGRPEMAVKFLSQRCIDVFGMRGYTVVIDENGSLVKCGTLIMAEIPRHIAERRRMHYVQQSEQLVKDSEQNYADEVAKIRAAAKDLGVRTLESGELMTANATETEGFLGQKRAAGVSIGRQQ